MKAATQYFLALLVVGLAAFVLHEQPFGAPTLTSYQSKPGDVILFRATDEPYWYKLITPFTHVGVAINDEEMIEIHLQGTGLGAKTEGVHIYNIAERVAASTDDVYVCQLNKTIPEPVLPMDTLMPLRYNTNYYMDTLKCRVLGQKPTHAKLQCAEFSAKILKLMGIAQEQDTSCLRPGEVVGLKLKESFAYGKPKFISSIYKS